MAVMWISFRIADVTVAGKSYDDRLNALIEALQGVGTQWWDQTTSFIVVETANTVGDVAGRIKAALAPSVDLALIRAMDSKDARIIGNNADDDIYVIMPYLKGL